jgi:hypothetical protein
MKRLILPDLLKGFAVFLIVPVHILEILIDYQKYCHCHLPNTNINQFSVLVCRDFYCNSFRNLACGKNCKKAH